MDEGEADAVGAFVPGPRVRLPGAPEGPLAGLGFGVKDLYDVAGYPTSFGNPDWARAHPEAAGTAPCVAALLEAGADLRGKTRTVELAYGLTGENPWHGTPTNPAAPDRYPGGSSCGSAAAVAAGLVDFALGSDTGGSVRIPASYCGIFGHRPSWGAVSLVGAAPLAPSFDTAGWFAGSAAVLRQVGEVLLPPGSDCDLGPLLKVQEAWLNALPATAAALGPLLDAAAEAVGPVLSVSLVPEGLAEIHECLRLCQGEEAWVSHGSWIGAASPAFSPAVAGRFAAARALDPVRVAAARAFRQRLRQRLRAVLGGGAVLVMPTAPAPAPRLSDAPEELQTVREWTMGVTALSSLGGLCEVTLPAARVDGAPVGLSLVADHGRDRSLLLLAERLAGALGLTGVVPEASR